MKMMMLVLFLALSQMGFANESSSSESQGHKLRILFRSVVPTSLEADTGSVSDVGDQFAANGGYSYFKEHYIASTFVTPLDSNEQEQGGASLVPNGENEMAVSSPKARIVFHVILSPAYAPPSRFFRMTVYDGETVVKDRILELTEGGSMDAGIIDVEL